MLFQPATAFNVLVRLMRQSLQQEVSSRLGIACIMLRPLYSVEVQEGLACNFKQKLGFTQLLRIFSADASNTLICLIQCLHEKVPLFIGGHI